MTAVLPHPVLYAIPVPPQGVTAAWVTTGLVGGGVPERIELHPPVELAGDALYAVCIDTRGHVAIRRAGFG